MPDPITFLQYMNLVYLKGWQNGKPAGDTTFDPLIERGWVEEVFLFSDAVRETKRKQIDILIEDMLSGLETEDFVSVHYDADEANDLKNDIAARILRLTPAGTEIVNSHPHFKLMIPDHLKRKLHDQHNDLPED